MSTTLMMGSEVPNYLERLKKHRIMRGYSQKQVAEAIHTEICTYGAIERGGNKLKVDDAINIAKFYGISLDDLVGFGDYDTEGREHDEYYSRDSGRD